MTFRKLSARTSICLAFVVALALPGQLHSEEVLSRLITQPDPGSPGFEGADLMVTDTATGSSRFVATVVQPNEGPAGTGGAVGQINYDPVSRTVAVQYQLRSNGANPNVFGIKTYNVDTGGLISNVVSSPEGFGFGATDAYYALPPDNSAQVQQNTAQIASTSAQVQQNTAQIASNTSEIAKTQGEVQRLGAQVEENTSAIERNTAAIARQEKRIDENSEGVAMALAMAGGASLPNRKTLALSGGWGTFEGSNALGFGAIGRVSDKVYLTGGVGMGLNNSTVGGRAGFLFAW
jgi:trimeric autotransporter adhesin